MKVYLFFTLFLPCFSQLYDHELRNFWMPLAAAAYSDNPRQCLSNIQKSDPIDGYPNRTITFHRQYNVKCTSLNGTCSGFIGVDSYKNDTHFYQFYVSFRGPENFEEFYEQTWNPDEFVPFVKSGKVNKQLFDAFTEIWINAGMKNDVLALKNKHQNCLFIFLGHSTGGAMASLAAATAFSTGILKSHILYLITFGEPRSGDYDYANAFEYMNFYSYRIVHNADIVSHLPPMNETSYYHHVQELWYHNNMGLNDTFSLCLSYEGEDPKCSNSLNDTMLNFEDHKNYYGRKFVEYGINGCPGLTTLKQKNFKLQPL